MLKPPKPFRLRSMRLSDIPHVMSIEALVFHVPWKASAYEYEIGQNRLARYKVLTVQVGDRPEQVVGYAGLWKLSDEAHISTIAVHPNWQGKGLGELLLLDLLIVAYTISVDLVTLEVRKSNVKAQALYNKYHFNVVGQRPRYYQGKEDALIMTLATFDKRYWQSLKGKRKRLFDRLSGVTSGKGSA